MVRKPAAKPASAKPAPTKPVPAKPVRDPVTLPEAAAFTSDIRTLVVNLTILLAIIIVVPVIVMQFWRSQVVIEPLAVPDGMVATGLTPEVAAGRLWDGLEAVTAAAGTAKRSVVSIPESAKVDFAIPDSGLSIDSLVYYVRQFFNSYETRVSGEFRCADADCAPEGQSLRIRVVSNQVDLIDLPPRGAKSEETYFRDAAAEVMARLDPFTALAAVSTTNPERGKVLARRLIRTNHPDAKWAHNLLGNLVRDSGDPLGALAEYQAALAIDPDFSQALANRAGVLTEQGDLVGARAALDRVLARDKDDIYALSGYGDVLLAEGKADEAVTYFRRAAAVRPLPPIFLDRAANALFGLGRTDDAAALFREALEIDPGDTMALASTALIYMNQEKYDEAERVARAGAEFAPDNAMLLSLHASMLRQVKRFDEALERAEKAVKLAPDVAGYHETMAKTLIDLGRHDEALTALAKAESLAPDDPDLVYALGDIYRLKGDSAAAIAAYNRFLEIAPEDPLRQIAEMQISLLGGTPVTAEAPAVTSAEPAASP